MREFFVLSYGLHMRQRVVDCFVLQNNVIRTKSAFSFLGGSHNCSQNRISFLFGRYGKECLCFRLLH